MKEDIFGLSLAELSEILEKSGFEKFRAKQIYNWLFVRFESDFQKMQNLPKNLRDFLEQNFSSNFAKIIKEQKSTDGSVKYLFETQGKIRKLDSIESISADSIENIKNIESSKKNNTENFSKDSIKKGIESGKKNSAKNSAKNTKNSIESIESAEFIESAKQNVMLDSIEIEQSIESSKKNSVQIQKKLSLDLAAQNISAIQNSKKQNPKERNSKERNSKEKDSIKEQDSIKSISKSSFEAVFLKMKDDKFTICISSQIGCKVGCAFCMTARGGFVRDLCAGEIVYQVWAIKKAQKIPSNKAVNIVFMGMGEPLDNLESVAKAVKILAENDGLCISPRRQTISTSGIAPKIRKLGALNLGVQLAISLHAVDDELRSELIPMNKAYNIRAIIDEVAAFPIDTRKRVMFEYLVLGEVNDDLKCAKKLVALLNKIRAKVNLIYFNPHEGSPYKRPQRAKVEAFREFLLQKGLLCTIRESKGLDIDAACGQLREREISAK